MELHELDDEKSRLIKRSAQQKAALGDEMNNASERTEKMISNALVIGGGLLVSYLVVRKLTKKSKSKKRKAKQKAMAAPQYVIADREEEEEEEAQPSVLASAIGQIGTVVASQATAFLLGIAQEKLMEYLDNRKTNTANDENT